MPRLVEFSCLLGQVRQNKRTMNSSMRNFLFPKPDRRFWIRMAVVAATAYVFFGHVCLPMKVRGISMAPTYSDGGLNFCWRPAFWFKTPRRGDVVMIRFAGRRVSLLKRIIGLAGDTIAFESGVLIRNGEPAVEPYAAGPCDWNLSARTVSAGCVYVAGDNRAVDMNKHMFGEIKTSRILGAPLW